jgi:hypothetical protein
MPQLSEYRINYVVIMFLMVLALLSPIVAAQTGKVEGLVKHVTAIT